MKKKNKEESQHNGKESQHKLWRKLAIYILAFLLPLGYAFLLSDSNYVKHRQLSEKIEEVKKENKKVSKYLEDAHSPEEIQQNPALMEKYIREQLNMKKSSEDVFIIRK